MNSIFHPPITLILKNNTWVPRRERRPSILDEHGLTLLETLGEGSYAKVKLAESSKQKVAVKIMDKRRLPKDYLEKYVPREVRVMSMLKHPNIVSLHDVFETPIKVFIVMEYADGGDLLQYINNKMYTTEEDVQKHFKQILSAVSTCHQQLIAHRDLKCENILLDKYNNIKLTDFGFSRVSNKTMMLETMCGSLLYASPELIRGDHYSGYAVDCWSLGIILYGMLCAKLPYQQEDVLALARCCENVEPIKFHDNLSQEAKDVVHGLLDPDPITRLTCEIMEQIQWCKPEKFEVSETTERTCDILPEENTAVYNHGDSMIILNKVVRPCFGNIFSKAMSRQKINLYAISAFKQLRQKVKRQRAAASYFDQGRRTRKCSVVSELIGIEHNILNERRKTLAHEKSLNAQIRRKSLVKDVEISHNKTPHTNREPFSSNDYNREFMETQRTERTKELDNLSYCSSSQLARVSQKQKNLMRKSTQTDFWFEVGSNEDFEDEHWARKCFMACNRSSN